MNPFPDIKLKKVKQPELPQLAKPKNRISTRNSQENLEIEKLEESKEWF